MGITRPTGEQLRFRSATTGDHILDTYMENSEKGSRTLPDLMDDLFDSSGVFRSANFEFRFDTTTDKIQFRAGNFANSNTGWTDITTFFNITGAFNASTTYNNFDLITLTNKDVYIVHGLSSGTTFADEAAVIASANTEKLVDVSEARDWAKKTDGIVDSTDYSSKAWAIGGTGVTNGANKGAAKEWATKTGSTVDGSDYSAKHWATTGTVATVSSGIANINTVAAAIANVNTTATNISNVNTVAGISANVTTVAGISANVTTVATNNANITTVATNNSNINSLATNMADINTVADEIDNNKLQTVADNINAVVTAADDLNESTSEIEVVANNIANVNTVGGSIANVNTVAGIAANVTTVAGISANTTTVAGIAANVTTVAGIAADVTTAASNVTAFNNTYLGAQSSAPTQDPDGSALDVGDLYFDTTSNTMKVYASGGWTSAGSSVNGTANRYSYTATAGQTVFAATYDAGYVDVYLNGVKQLVGTDVTATSGTSVVFASGTTVNDIVEIIAYGTFVLSDHLTQTQSDARYVQVAGDTMTGNLLFGDGDAARFGTHGDLTFEHDLNNSNIVASNNKPLNITANGVFNINSDNIFFREHAASNTYMEMRDGGGYDHAVRIFHSGTNVRLETTSTGVDVTGSLNVSGGESIINGYTNSTKGALSVKANASHWNISLEENNGAETWQLGINADGDLSFHNSGSPTPSVMFDDNGRVAIGGTTVTDVNMLNIQGSGASSNIGIVFNDTNTSKIYGIQNGGSSLKFFDYSASATRMTIDTSGNVIANSGSLNLVGTNTQIFASSNGDDIQFKFSGTKKASINNGGLISASDGSAVVPGFRFVDDANTGMYRSASDTISFSTAGSERMRIRPDGAVRIYDSGQLGDTSGTPLILGNKNVSKQMEIGVNDSALTNPYITIIGRNSGNSTARSMSIGVQADSQYSYITDSNNSNDFRIYAGGNVVPSGNVVMGNGQGIDFSATANGSGTTTSELFSDYEEGTFSPVMVGSTSGTFTSLNLGRYTKIGRSVSIQLTFNNITYNAVVGNLKITNLPFATNLTDTVDLYVPVQVYRLNWPSDAKDIYAFQNSSNSTQLELYYSRDNNTSAQLLGTHLAGTYFRMTWSYNTA